MKLYHYLVDFSTLGIQSTPSGGGIVWNKKPFAVCK